MMNGKMNGKQRSDAKKGTQKRKIVKSSKTLDSMMDVNAPPKRFKPRKATADALYTVTFFNTINFKKMCDICEQMFADVTMCVVKDTNKLSKVFNSKREPTNQEKNFTGIQLLETTTDMSVLLCRVEADVQFHDIEKSEEILKFRLNASALNNIIKSVPFDATLQMYDDGSDYIKLKYNVKKRNTNLSSSCLLQINKLQDNQDFHEDVMSFLESATIDNLKHTKSFHDSSELRDIMMFGQKLKLKEIVLGVFEAEFTLQNDTSKTNKQNATLMYISNVHDNGKCHHVFFTDECTNIDELKKKDEDEDVNGCITSPLAKLNITDAKLKTKLCRNFSLENILKFSRIFSDKRLISIHLDDAERNVFFRCASNSGSSIIATLILCSLSKDDKEIDDDVIEFFL
jgi:hypothetical protein